MKYKGAGEAEDLIRWEIEILHEFGGGRVYPDNQVRHDRRKTTRNICAIFAPNTGETPANNRPRFYINL